ncbi:alpha/beta hydrolase family protein [Mesorhizobium hawassense]|nr:alpha/beta fold hydrolase [Mesorhizobium hawassense]
MNSKYQQLQINVPDARVLHADFYSPEGEDPHPTVIGIHGGGWNQGSRGGYQHWGQLLAENGYALLAVDRWHFNIHETPYPTVIADLREVIKFCQANSSFLRIDPDRIALMGASSGAYIAAMVGLDSAAGNQPSPSVGIKAVVAAYGVYDLAAEWSYEQMTRPLDKSIEWLLGCALYDNRAAYFEASPLSRCVRSNNRIPFLVAWGTEDSVVSEQLQSQPFARALALAGFDVTTCILPYAQHYWLLEPLDQALSQSAMFAPRLLRFLNRTIKS